MLPCISLESQRLDPPVSPVCPEAPVWPVEPLAPASRHDSLHWLTGIPFLCNALTACHACMHLNGKPESEPTCETHLPRGPGLACGAACPCKQSQCLTLSSMPPLLKAALSKSDMLADIAMARNSPNLPVRPVCPEAPVWPVEPLAPASIHNASCCVTCLTFSVQNSDGSP